MLKKGYKNITKFENVFAIKTKFANVELLIIIDKIPIKSAWKNILICDILIITYIVKKIIWKEKNIMNFNEKNNK